MANTTKASTRSLRKLKPRKPPAKLKDVSVGSPFPIFKPKAGQKYYYVRVGCDGVTVHHFLWSNIPGGDSIDAVLYKSGNCFKTKEAAQDVANYIKVLFQNPGSVVMKRVIIDHDAKRRKALVAHIQNTPAVKFGKKRNVDVLTTNQLQSKYNGHYKMRK